MAITAKIVYSRSEFVAALSDGRHVERQGWRELALALYELGIKGNAIEYEWRAGQRMITAGQQVALKAEIRRLTHTLGNANDHAVAA